MPMVAGAIKEVANRILAHRSVLVTVAWKEQVALAGRLITPKVRAFVEFFGKHLASAMREPPSA